MLRRLTSRSLLQAAVLLAFCLTLIVVLSTGQRIQNMPSSPQLLSDPFLQLPTVTSVRVVWFTEFAGTEHQVTYGENLRQRAIATTTKLSRMREDQDSRVGTQIKDGQVYQQPTDRVIWRHEAEVTKLTAGTRLPYRVISQREDGQTVASAEFTLAPQPATGTPLKILLTSDHQLKPMTAANLQQVVKTVGRVDAVLFAGDLVNIPDRASEWFDDNRGGALFPCLQGRANYELEHDGVKTTYTGGQLIQNAPVFTAIGNHEVMGRYASGSSLDDEFNNPQPRAVAQEIYQQQSQQLNPGNDPSIRDRWLQDNSFNTNTYEEIFTLPESSTGGKTYYATTFGDLRLVVLYATNMWRTPNLDANDRGRYQEREQDLNQPENWGYGQLIFGAIAQGSEQYNWLEKELNSSEFRQAKYKVVMLHHPPHSLGDNIVPAYTEPVQIVERDRTGKLIAVRYQYPKESDYIIRDVLPLLAAAKVQLVFYGHSHLWNRFVSPEGMHFLETSNVGNSYGAFVGNQQRPVPRGNHQDYVATGDPNGLEPAIPTLAPLLEPNNQPMPYIASNDITVFSIFDTATGTVSSYRFDTRKPEAAAIKFDEFSLGSG